MQVLCLPSKLDDRSQMRHHHMTASRTLEVLLLALYHEWIAATWSNQSSNSKEHDQAALSHGGALWVSSQRECIQGQVNSQG